MARLEGKVAIIIGASGEGSMGQATARRFVKEGAKVVVSARRKDRIDALAKEIGALGVACDVSKDEDLAKLVEATLNEYGQLDVGVNFSGINVSSPIAEITPDKLRDAMDIHFMGSVLFIKHMANNMKNGGSVITTSTLTATLAPMGLSAYAGTKAGVDQVVRIAANEYGKQNIKVNSITPGFVATEMTAAAPPFVAKAFAERTALPRVGTVEDIANAALWLASDESFVSGQNIQINGGADMNGFPGPADFERLAQSNS